MADNFLENRMEMLRSGGFARRRSVARKPAGPALHDAATAARLRGKRVLLLADSYDELLRDVANSLRESDLKVAFAAMPSDDATELARHNGAQYHPVCPADYAALEQSLRLIARSWRGLDAVVLLSDRWQHSSIVSVIEGLSGKLPLSPFKSARISCVLTTAVDTSSDCSGNNSTTGKNVGAGIVLTKVCEQIEQLLVCTD